MCIRYIRYVKLLLDAINFNGRNENKNQTYHQKKSITCRIPDECVR